MIRYTSKTVSFFALLFLITNVFATVMIKNKPAFTGSKIPYSFSGKVYGAAYMIDQDDSTSINLYLTNDRHETLVLAFKDNDFIPGAAYLNAIGRPLTVFYSDSGDVLGIYQYGKNKIDL